MVHRDTGSPDIAAARRQYLRMNRTATVAMDWRHRIDIRTAKTDRPPADAL